MCNCCRDLTVWDVYRWAVCDFSGVRCSAPEWRYPDYRDPSVCLLEWAFSLPLSRIHPAWWAWCFHVHSSEFLVVLIRSLCTLVDWVQLYIMHVVLYKVQVRRTRRVMSWWSLMMETEEEFPSQTSGFCPQDIKFTVSIKVKIKIKQNTGWLRKWPLTNDPLGAEPSPALLSPGRRGRRSSAQEKRETFTDKPTTEDPAGRPQEKRPGEMSSTTISSV